MAKKTKKIIAENAKEVNVKPGQPSVFDALNKKTVYVVLFLTALIAFFVFKDFLLYKKVYMFKDIGSDTLNANLPYLELLINYFRQYGTLSWSFSNGMGQSVFPLFLRDPFDLISFAGGNSSIFYLLGFKEFLKIIIAAFLFYLYLNKLGLNNFTKIVGSILFAFCGFIIVGGGWYAFSYEALNFILLMLGFELLFQDNKGLVFTIATLLFAASMPFNLYVYGLFVVLYAPLRFYSSNGEFKTKTIFLLYGKMLLYGVIGTCMAGPLLLENINQILTSPRGSGENSYFHQLINMPMFEVSNKAEFGTSMMRFFSSDIIGTGNNFKGWGNTLEAPLYYCGLPCLLLLPQLFLFLSKRKKIVFALFLAFWCLPIIFPYFRRALWLFSGDYYRSYSFFVSMCFLIYSMMALDFIIKKRSINLIVLGGTVVLLFIIISYPYFGNRSIIDSGIGIFVKLFIVLYALILVLFTKSKEATIPLLVFLSLVCFEVFYMSNISVNKRESVKVAELSQRTGYNDYSVEATAFVKKYDSGFFRIDKDYYSSPAMHGSLNDAMIHNYYGTSAYNGFAEKSYIDYQKNYDIISKTDELQARWAIGLINRVILESINSVKYLFIKNNQNPIWKVSHDSIAQFGDVKILKGKFNLPLGFCYDTYLKESDFQNLSRFQKDYVSLNAVIVNDEDISEVKNLKAFNPGDTIFPQNFTLDQYGYKVNLLRKDTLKIESFSENRIKGNILLDNAKVMYFSIPFNKGWTITVNNNKIKPLLVSNGMIGVPLLKGNNIVELVFKHLYVDSGIILSLVALVSLIGLLFVVNKWKKS